MLNLTNQNFGKLIVLKETDRKDKKHRYWECLCKCGNTVIVRQDALTSGTTKSCNHCLEKELIGQVFGKLTVIAFHHADGHRYWKCSCECGTEKILTTAVLRNGGTRSCGCSTKGVITERVKRFYVEGTSLLKLDITGTKGVNRDHGKWRARITFKGKTIHLGTFEKKEDAIKVRKKAEKEYFKPILDKYKKLK